MKKLRAKSTVYISNLSEDVWPFIKTLKSKIRTTEILENQRLSDRDIFSFGESDHTLFIMPQKLDPEFWHYFLNLFGLTNCQVISPRKHTGEICKDIKNDPKVLQAIYNWAQESKELSVISYSSTPQFFNLVEFLKKQKIHVKIPESPKPALSKKIDMLGSKSGIRKFDLPLVNGKVFTKINAATEYAAKEWWAKGSVVIKTNKAHSGVGVLILHTSERPTSLELCKKHIAKLLKAERYWQSFPIVVEDFVGTNFKISGGFPDAEFKITPSGKPTYLYTRGMRVTPEGVHKGLEIGNNCLPQSIVTQLKTYGRKWGEKLSENGYLGYYDVDCLLGMNGNLYFSESNVRRTGGTHVYHAAKALFGPKYLTKTYVLSQNMYSMPKKVQLTFTQLLAALGTLVFNPKTKEGVVITSVNLLKNYQFGYIIFGKSKKSASAIEKVMENTLIDF